MLTSVVCVQVVVVAALWLVVAVLLVVEAADTSSAQSKRDDQHALWEPDASLACHHQYKVGDPGPPLPTITTTTVASFNYPRNTTTSK